MAHWTRPTYHGLLKGGDPNVDDPNRAFNGGRIDDVLPVGGTLLLASPYSSVWNTSDFSDAPAFNFTEWFPKPNLTSLALGTQSDTHVFAGGDALYETDTTHAFPLANWKQVTIPPNAGTILRILVLKNSRRVVLACEGGLFWSGIPDTGGSYSWIQVLDPNNVGKPWNIAFSGIAEGPNETVVAGIRGAGDTLNSGFYHGRFNRHISGPHRFTRLDMTRSNTAGNNAPDWTQMGRISIASCAADRNLVFALTADFNNATIYRTVISSDGGATWSNTGNLVVNNPLNNGALWENGGISGGQGWYVNCIAVAPTKVDNDHITVAIGWSSGYFLSSDSGSTWTQIAESSSAHLHADVHGLTFDPTDLSSRTLYIASDGGLAITRDLGATHTSRQNVGLYNLLISHLTVSYQNPGLVAVSCQDLGDMSCYVDSSITEAWKPIDDADGDGTGVLFTRNGRLLHILNTETEGGVEFANLVRDAIWDSSAEKFQNQHYFPTDPLSRGVIPVDGTSNGLALWAYGLDYPVGPFSLPICPMSIVNAPKFKNPANETMIAVAARGAKKTPHIPPWFEIIGLFSNIDDGNWRSNKGHWTILGRGHAQLDEHPVSAGSADGTEVWVGTGKGRILRFDITGIHSDEWLKWEDMTPAGNTEPIWEFVLNGDLKNYAISTGASLFRESLRIEKPGREWRSMPGPSNGEGYTAMTTDWTTNPKALYLATINHIYVSRDEAATWQEISGTANGLPAVPNATSLEFLVQGSRTTQRKRLFLGTYGWGLYSLDL
jgi:hypothetical protein